MLFMRVALLMFALAALFGSCRRDDPEPEVHRDPNILLIMTDDQGWGDLSLHGNPILETPNIDTLARQGVRFDRFYVSPVCAPTRASLLTGRYHLRTGTSWVTHRKEVMRSTEATIAEFLQAEGYRTGLFGKWHNGAQYPNDPLGQGFDEFVGFTAGHWNNYFNTKLIHNGDTIQPKGFITDVLTDAAIDFIAGTEERPFFCYVPYNAPHSPFQVPERYYEKYRNLGADPKNAAVYGMVENIDDNVGRLLHTLDSLGIAENTIVVFLTDNGPNGQRYNGGMKGKKADVDEGGVRVPCFIRWPGHLPENYRVVQLAAHIDLLPTLLAMAGHDLTPVNPLDGRNLMPLLSTDSAGWKERAIYNVRTDGELRLFPGAIRTPAYRLVIDPQNQSHLYHMGKDPGQKTDLVESHPELADSLRRRYERWFEAVTKAGIESPPIPVGYPQSLSVELPAPEAILYGNIHFQGSMGWANDYLVDWQSPADSAMWTVLPVDRGPYDVFVEFTATEAAVGTQLRVTVDSVSVRAPITEAYDPEIIPSPDRVERGEVYEKEWKRLSLGPLPLSRRKHRLRLTIDRELQPGALEVKAVWLQKREMQ